MFHPNHQQASQKSLSKFKCVSNKNYCKNIQQNHPEVVRERDWNKNVYFTGTSELPNSVIMIIHNKHKMCINIHLLLGLKIYW